ncbi:glycine zipper 2TM domain-containing protein [Comamonas terrae]|uniref:Glycine zipper 2TM domain-containing protein n=1 Tax=Comamonas terrae TaxID=673548 RepID=A0ABW5UPY2_9BURK|nr:glycine zipper 2TM domain-containing protein [Comamonas terrae]
MKPLAVMTLVAATASMSTVAFAQERGRVLSTTPITQQVVVPQQVCNDQAVAVAPRSTGAGAVIGAIAGGVLGNAIGGGAGRAAATAAGAVGGAMLGNQAEAYGPPQYQTVRQCSTQNYYQNQTVGYNVVYEYRGRNYTTQTSTPPGDWIALNVTPADNGNLYNSNGYYDNPAPAQVYGTVPVAPAASYQSGYYAPQPAYTAGDYVAPLLIGAAIGAGAYYATRPHYHGYYRPGWRGGWRR